MVSISVNAAPGSIAIAARAVAGLLTGWTLVLLRRRQRRAAIRELQLLDDRELRDLGLYRGQIKAAVYGMARSQCEVGNLS